MRCFGENSFQSIGNIGEIFAADLLTSPIRRMINRDAKRAGIDVRNSRRSIASLFSSCGMGVALGAVLGPPGGILGYVVAIGSDYEGDNIENTHDSDTEETVLYISNSRLLKLRLRRLKMSFQGRSGLKYAMKSILR